MVSTYQQYLYPDFLNSTSVDSNKSPLALLAQTCNSIGTTDVPSQAQGQKRKHSFDGNTSLSSATSSSASKTEKLATDTKTQHDGGGHKNKVPKSSPHQADSTTSGDETSSGGGASCSTSNFGQKETKNDKSAENSNNNNNSNQSHETTTNDTTNSSSSSGQKMMPQQMPPHCSTFLPNQTFNSLLNGTHPALGMGSLNPLLSGAFFYPPTTMSHAGLNYMPGFPSTAALAASNPYYPSSAAAAAAAAAALSSAFYPKCTDPFCKTCPMSASGAASLYHHNTSRPCPTGCLQCATVAATHPLSTAGNDLTSWYQAYCSLFQPPQVAPPPQPILPPAFSFAPPPTSATTPTCFWDTGDGRYCMKRFTNAEEFSQHIKTHTEQLQKTSTPQTSPLQKPPSASPKNVAAPTMSLPPPSAYFNPLMHQYRYHPYVKFANANDILMPPPTSLYNAAALMQQHQQSTAQQQRLPGSLPFP